MHISGAAHLVPCLNVLLCASEIPELESCLSSRASDITVACLEVAASGNETDLLLALRKPCVAQMRICLALLKLEGHHLRLKDP